MVRRSDQADITSVVLANDETRRNQIGAFTKYGSVVDVGGTNYNVWVSDQTLSSSSDFVVDVA